MKLASITFSVRHFGAIALGLLVVGIGVGTALVDPAARIHDYYA